MVKQGINKVIQKVGEEAVELVIEAKDDNEDLFKNEAADLLYHFLILLKVKNIKLENVEQILSLRSKKSRGWKNLKPQTLEVPFLSAVFKESMFGRSTLSRYCPTQ